MTKRETILATAADILGKGYTDLKSVEINRSTPVERDVTPYPAGFLYSGPFRRLDNGAIGQDEWEWEIIVEVFWDGKEAVETVWKKLYLALANNTLSGACDWFILKSGREFVNDSESTLQFTFECRYHNTFGTP